MPRQGTAHTTVHYLCSAQLESKIGCRIRMCPLDADYIVAILILGHGVRTVILCSSCRDGLLTAIRGRRGGMQIVSPINMGSRDASMGTESQNDYYPVAGARTVLPL